MPLGGFIGILGAIVSVAALAVFLSSNNTAAIVKNVFDGFSGALTAAMGR